MRTSALILLSTLLSLGCSETTLSASPVPKALIIIIDGVPADVIENVSTPNLDEISGERGYTRAFIGGLRGEPSESPTVSAVGYNSMLTGTWSNKHNVWDNDIDHPDYAFWDIFRVAKNHDPSLQTAIFSTWLDNRTKLLGDGLEEAGGAKLDYHFDGFEHDTDRFPHDLMAHYIQDIDEIVASEAARYVEAEGPDLSWVYLQYSDDIGHRYGDGSKMIAAVQGMDTHIGKIWGAVKNRQQMHNEDWMILITTDHGRKANSGRGHGGQTDRERLIWIVTNSDNLNSRFYQLPAIVDILPSIARHLRLEIPADIQEQLDGISFVD